MDGPGPGGFNLAVLEGLASDTRPHPPQAAGSVANRCSRSRGRAGRGEDGGGWCLSLDRGGNTALGL